MLGLVMTLKFFQSRSMTSFSHVTDISIHLFIACHNQTKLIWLGTGWLKLIIFDQHVIELEYLTKSNTYENLFYNFSHNQYCPYKDIWMRMNEIIHVLLSNSYAEHSHIHHSLLWLRMQLSNDIAVLLIYSYTWT